MKILKFNAIWCSGCIVMKKVMKEIEEDYPNIEIESYDYDMDEEMVNKYNIGDIIPVLVFLDEKETLPVTVSATAAGNSFVFICLEV